MYVTEIFIINGCGVTFSGTFVITGKTASERFRTALTLPVSKDRGFFSAASAVLVACQTAASFIW
jgi:hypothetical protein